MRNISALLAAIVLSGYAPPGLADDQSDVAAVAQAWATAFSDCDGAKSASLYDQEAILWGDYARTMVTTPASITDYFTARCGETYRRSVTINEQRIRVYGDSALNTGIYTTARTFGERSQSTQQRFSFAYRRKSGRWLIVDHHTSLMPEETGPPAPPARQGDSADTPLILLRSSLPNYPEEVIADEIEGVVDIRFTIDETGLVRDPQVVSSPDERLTAECLRVLNEWRFQPVQKEGKAVKIEAQQRFPFKLQG